MQMFLRWCGVDTIAITRAMNQSFFPRFCRRYVSQPFHLRLHGSDPQFQHGVEFDGVLLPSMSGNVKLYDDIVERFVRLKASKKNELFTSGHTIPAY